MSTRALSLGMGGAVVLAATLIAPAVHADAPRYRYVALDQVALPAPYASFSPVTVVDGRVFGTVFDASYSVSSVAEYHDGKITIGPAGSASIADETGLVGGADPSSEAALFKGDRTTLVPRLPGEQSATVTGLGDGGLALVASTDASYVTTFAYFRHGVETVIDFGLPDPVFGGFMNDEGTVAVTKEESPTDPYLHGYRYDPRTRTTTLLRPFAGDPTDVMVLVQGINDRGDVLGYSFTNFNDPSYHERVGVWDRAAVFHPYIEETNNSSLLVFNDHDEIVISNSSDGHSYLVPRPGTRLDLASLVANMPSGLEPVMVVSLDDDGNMTGFATDDTFSNFYPFLLVPMRDHERDPDPAHVGPCPVPWAVAHQSDRRHPRK